MNIDLIKQKAGIVGESDAINQVLEMVAQVANVDISVLINGESGTGKELVSKAETETEKEFAKKISKRTLQSLIDEDSHEDHPGKEWFENYLKEEDIKYYCKNLIDILY